MPVMPPLPSPSARAIKHYAQSTHPVGCQHTRPPGCHANATQIDATQIDAMPAMQCFDTLFGDACRELDMPALQ